MLKDNLANQYILGYDKYLKILNAASNMLMNDKPAQKVPHTEIMHGKQEVSFAQADEKSDKKPSLKPQEQKARCCLCSSKV